MNYKGSLSGLVRFAKGKGKTVILKLLEEFNKKNETSVQFGQLLILKTQLITNFIIKMELKKESLRTEY
jgi:hypothetical protein